MTPFLSGPVVCSGGIDSVTLAYFLAASGRLTALWPVNYGQQAWNAQFDAVAHYAKLLSVPYEPVLCRLPTEARGRGTLFRIYDAKHEARRLWNCTRWREGGAEQYRFPASHRYWKCMDYNPCRALYWYTHVAMRAIARKIPCAYVGFQMEPPFWQQGGYAPHDNSPEFVAAFNDTLVAGAGGTFELIAPWLDLRMERLAITHLGQTLGIDYRRTYSCERHPPCGKCHQCNSRRLLLRRLEKES